MGYQIKCFKGYKVANKMDFSGDYQFEMLDFDDGNFIYPSVLTNISDYLEKYNLQDEWSNIIPNFGEVFMDSISQSEAQDITKRLRAPECCLRFINKYNIIKRLETDKPEDYESMISVIEQLVIRWRNNYFVIETY